MTVETALLGAAPLGTGAHWARIFRSAVVDSAATRVQIRMVAYAPKEIRIRAGQSVELVNLDPVEHTVTADDGSWGSELLKEGQRYTRRFDWPGRYPYHCIPPPQMTGVVIVEVR